MLSPAPDLEALLRRTFGHPGFRAHQREVCEAAAAGRDVLLVMPTGAGKSLCYQLPALARNGTALVISPLIALMDDQASKLAALNLRVARIHSGLPREAARQACRDYLAGALDFLFIAPERLRVPGFPEMLAKRKPALVAIDEAHCISQWGHDFRPDYRTLGQHLPALRPSPVIALTATATPAVQQDILRALQLQSPEVFITGFRRDNLHIEVQELSKPERIEFITATLQEEARRPAIVYATSRKSAEEIAGKLHRHFPSAVYHAGLDATTRDKVQTGFLSGRLEVIVATVAFGMGVDKADIRTVLHAALPASVEAYYQEIGRAGRDGKPSRTILLHNYGDRRTQEFLIDRSFPALSDVERVAAILTPAPRSFDDLQQQLDMDRETLERCLDKLLAHGVALPELDGSIRAAAPLLWQENYNLQIQHRRNQLDRMVAYAEGAGCRMSALIRHFGDLSDGGRPCGLCDICRPASAAADAHQPTAQERDDLRALLVALAATGSRSAGKLFTDLRWPDRKRFDALTLALAKAGLLSITTDTFRGDDGRDISYRKLAITPEGRTPDDPTLATVWLRETAPPGSRSRTKSSQSSRAERPSSVPADTPLTAEQASLEAQLKQWRLEKAKALGIPAFTIFHDSVLRAIARACPQNIDALSRISGIGPEKQNRYAEDLLAFCRQEPSERHLTSSPKRVKDQPSRTPAPKSREEAPRVSTVVRTTLAPRPKLVPSRQSPTASPEPLNASQQQSEQRLREWRREQAATLGLPTFFVLSDTLLHRVAAASPRSIADLHHIADLGRDKVERYGAAIVDLCHA